jgi:plastocyanin
MRMSEGFASGLYENMLLLPTSTNYSSSKPRASADAEAPTFQVTVNDTNPLWVYCGQPGHCSQGQLTFIPSHFVGLDPNLWSHICCSFPRTGMVFAINPPAEGNERSFSAFKQKALASGNSTASSSSTSAETSYTPPPPQSWTSATATITSQSSVWVTTYSSYEGTPQPTYGANGPTDHQIVVGDSGQLSYNPANITGVAIGDTVTFTFRPKNHTVTQSTFANPCQRMDNGFASGLYVKHFIIKLDCD